MQAADLLELRDDLSRECSRLHKLVSGLSDLGQRLEHSADAVEVSALRLHSFYTGVERMLLLISRVVNGEAHQLKVKAGTGGCWNAWRWPPTPGRRC